MKNINIEVISKSPGKCLICGGYLILNKNKKGVVFNIDTYIESKCEIENYEYKEKEEFLIKIYSDYEKQEYNYNIIFKDNSLNIIEEKKMKING
jgi:phosphomevalonate kinase